MTSEQQETVRFRFMHGEHRNTIRRQFMCKEEDRSHDHEDL